MIMIISMITIVIISMSLISKTWPSVFIMIRRLSPWLWDNALRWAIWFSSPVLGSWSQCIIKSTSWNMSSLPNCQTCDFLFFLYIVWGEINGLVEEKRNSSALAKGATSLPHQPNENIKICIDCNTVCDNCQTRQKSIERHRCLHM